jgi:rhodanese-related sulfurtransferase
MGLLKKFFGSKGEEKKVAPSTPAAPEPEPEFIQVREVSPQDLKARLDNGDEIVVVDMRQSWEYQHGHIPGATHMFVNEIPARINELPKDKDIVFQCWHGNTSLQASAYLIENGWSAERVASLEGGIAGWVQTNGQASLVTE